MSDLLAAKLGLEAEIARPVAQICTSYITAWAETGAMPFLDRLRYQAALEAALSRHYARVIAVTLGRPMPEGLTLDEAALSMAQGVRLRQRAQVHAVHMIATLDRDLAAAAALALPTEAKQEVPPGRVTSGWSVAFVGRFKETAKQAWTKLKAKLRGIANVETQEVAEDALFEFVKQAYADSTIVKVWVTMADERVRPTHVEAEGQERRVDEPFDVGGGKLRFPGDTSLGAPLKEIINCRCSCSYVAVRSDGTRAPLGLGTPHIPARRIPQPGDRFGAEKPISPTTLVTLNGNTRAQIVLGDGQTIATLRQVSPSVINVSVNGTAVARAVHQNGVVTAITVAPGYEAQGIETLIRSSVAHSASRRR